MAPQRELSDVVDAEVPTSRHVACIAGAGDQRHPARQIEALCQMQVPAEVQRPLVEVRTYLGEARRTGEKLRVAQRQNRLHAEKRWRAERQLRAHYRKAPAQKAPSAEQP